MCSSRKELFEGIPFFFWEPYCRKQFLFGGLKMPWIYTRACRSSFVRWHKERETGGRWQGTGDLLVLLPGAATSDACVRQIPQFVCWWRKTLPAAAQTRSECSCLTLEQIFPGRQAAAALSLFISLFFHFILREQMFAVFLHFGI